MNEKLVVVLGFLAIVLIAFVFSVSSLWEHVDANEILVVQSPMSGELTWYTTPGVKWQGWGGVTKYPKRSMYEFETEVRFNDGGHGTMTGSVQYEMPLDSKNLIQLHSKFGSPDAIQKQMVEKVVDKSVYMTGPLMSSRESFAEKRNYLINYVEDQIAHGVYRTIQREASIEDPLTKSHKTIVVVEIVTEKGVPVRQEEAVLEQFGIKPFSFAISKLKYDNQVEAQIQEQQKITMQVQTAIAESRQAEQKAITVEQQGKASAAQARWEQEVIKAKNVTEAEQRRDVAKLDLESADLRKQATILLAEGEAEGRRLVMEADGALEKKLAAYIKVNEAYAGAIQNYKGSWVPQMVMGGGAASPSVATATDFVSLMTMKAAKDLSIDLSSMKGSQ